MKVTDDQLEIIGAALGGADIERRYLNTGMANPWRDVPDTSAFDFGQFQYRTRKMTGYVSVYADGGLTFHRTRHGADELEGDDRMACVRFEEGQYDD